MSGSGRPATRRRSPDCQLTLTCSGVRESSDRGILSGRSLGVQQNGMLHLSFLFMAKPGDLFLLGMSSITIRFGGLGITGTRYVFGGLAEI